MGRSPVRKVLYVSGTRAEYGLMKETLQHIQNHPNLDLEIAVTGMHLMPQFGDTIKEIKKDGWRLHRISATYEQDNAESMTRFVGKFIQLLTERIRKIHPQFILVLGDRGEMLGGAIVGAYLTIPVAHVHGGDVSSTVDEFVRHAITKLAHIHFPATKAAAERIIQMGEDPWRVHVVGAPGLDSVLNLPLCSKKELGERYHTDFSHPLVLVMQHPVTVEEGDAAKQMKETMEAVRQLRHQSIVIYPNADAGGRRMIRVIEQYRKYPFVQIIKSIPHRDYISLLKFSSVMVGNSSSGIIEAPSFHVPVVNIGTRQAKRERAGNTIEVPYKKNEIAKAIERTLFDIRFRDNVQKCKSPYGSGKAGQKIVATLNEIEINTRLLQKQLTILF